MAPGELTGFFPSNQLDFFYSNFKAILEGSGLNVLGCRLRVSGLRSGVNLVLRLKGLGFRV